MSIHIKSIQQKLTEILLSDWRTQISEYGPSQAQFDEKIETGIMVKPNQYILNILKSLNKMHKVLYSSLEEGQLENIFKEALRNLVKEIDEFLANIEIETKFAKTRVRVDLL